MLTTPEGMQSPTNYPTRALAEEKWAMPDLPSWAAVAHFTPVANPSPPLRGRGGLTGAGLEVLVDEEAF